MIPPKCHLYLGTSKMSVNKSVVRRWSSMGRCAMEKRIIIHFVWINILCFSDCHLVIILKMSIWWSITKLILQRKTVHNTFLLVQLRSKKWLRWCTTETNPRVKLLRDTINRVHQNCDKLSQFVNCKSHTGMSLDLIQTMRARWEVLSLAYNPCETRDKRP